MRKLCLPLILIATAAFAIGCEDGPDQTFQPAPSGAAGIWNNGNVDAAVTTGSPSFEAGYPTQNKVTLCSTDFRRERWAWMLTQPVRPPRQYAGIDLAKDDLWDGLTIDEAEQPPSDGNPTNPEGGLCQSIPLGYQGSCPSGIGNCNGSYWGDNQEVGFSWNVATHILDQMTLNLGYTGQLNTNNYTDHLGGSHNYTLAVGDIYRRDGIPFEIDWNDKADRAAKITDIFNAIMSTYADSGGVPFNAQYPKTCKADADCTAPGTVSVCECAHATTGDLTQCQAPGQCGAKDCSVDGNCLVSPNNGGGTYFGIRPMVVYIVGTAGVPQPALSTPTLIYNFFTKWEPYSNLDQTVTLDENGPTASGTPVGFAGDAGPTDDAGNLLNPPCVQQIGQTYGNLTSNCVAITGNATVDQVNVNKITHGLSHDQEHWTANVLGINQNFTSQSVANNPNAVVLDTDVPQPGDVTQDYEFDLRARGALTNDRNLQGSAMIMIEWARLLLEDVGRILGTTPKKLGDPGCIGFTNGVPNYVATNANKATYGCSGIEGLIIPSGGSGTSYTGACAVDGDCKSTEKCDTNAGACYAATTPLGTFFGNDPKLLTADPNANLNPTSNYDTVGFYASVLHPAQWEGAICLDGNASTDCIDSLSIWQNMLQMVTRVLGDGNILNLPREMQDRRYYFKFFGVAFVKYLKAFGNYHAAYPATANNFPNGTVGGGLGPSDLVNTQIDLESLFFDYQVAPGTGGAQTYDKFEYVDRTSIGKGAGGTNNYIPWDFEYGSDIYGGNQRYDNWYRRMDREEIGMYSTMLEHRDIHTPGQENNVNITNLFGSSIIAGNWSSFACATGTAGDPATNNCGTNPPLDPVQAGLTPCTQTTDPSTGALVNAHGSCAATQACVGGAPSYENGTTPLVCTTPCDFVTYPATGCQSNSKVCIQTGSIPPVEDGGAATPVEGCMNASMDKNGTTPLGQPILSHYPSAWSRTPFSPGHSPIAVLATDKHPEIGVAHVTVPNFVTGPYTASPAVPDLTGACPPAVPASAGQPAVAAWTKNAAGLCEAPLQSGTGLLAPNFNPLTPWEEVQPEVGFSIPIDGERDQWVSGGQFDYTGVLESYLVDYTPYVDINQPGCVAQDDAATACLPGFDCDPASKTCVIHDGTVKINAIEGQDFLGQVFLCQDPTTGDVLHVGMYDSALSVIDWLAAHPGNTNPNLNNQSAQQACQIILRSTPANNYIDLITSKAYGVSLNISGGQGLGRVTDVVLFDTSLIQAL